MKYVLLSACSETFVYSVPDIVSDNLRKYCLEFCDKWIYEGPEASKFKCKQGVSYTEEDFIDYLNKWLFKDEVSVLVENIGWIYSKRDIPKKYKNCERFEF